MDTLLWCDNGGANTEHNARYSELQEECPGSFLVKVEHRNLVNKAVDNNVLNVNKTYFYF